MLGQHNWARWYLDPAVVYLELDAGEGPREAVSAGGQGTAGMPLKEQLLRSPLCGSAAKLWLFMLFEGSSRPTNPSRGGGNCPPMGHALPASLLPCPPEAGSRAQARGVPGVPLPRPHSASSSGGGQVPGWTPVTSAPPSPRQCQGKEAAIATALPGGNDRLSVLRLLRSLMQRTRWMALIVPA